MKRTIGAVFCPVPVLCCIVLSFALEGCGGGDGNSPGQAVQTVPAESAAVTAHAVGGFRLEPSPPDTIGVKWDGQGPATVLSVEVSPGDTLTAGDTLVVLNRDIQSVIMERLEMEIQLASARLESMPWDSVSALELDSLTKVMDSLSVSGVQAMIAPLDGTVTSVAVTDSQRVFTGKRLVGISSVSGNLFTVFPPEDCTVSSWPEGAQSARLVEEYGVQAVYAGSEESIDALFRRLAAVDRTAVFDEQLISYVITSEKDTIMVDRVGEMPDGSILVLPVREIDGELVTWSR